jgi:flavin-dependent dehydrogenase
VVVDIAICGAGPAGCALAIALARAGYSVLMLEREATPAQRPGESLPPEVRVPLAALGIWEKFLAAGHLPASGNHAFWGEDTGRHKDFLFNPYGNGWHIDRRRFGVMLQQTAETAGAILHRGTRRVEVARAGKQWRLTWRDRSGLRSGSARFVADATGRARGLARRLGVPVRRYDRLIGRIGSVPPSGLAEATTLIEAVPLGWWYSAPLPSTEHMVAFMSDPDVLPSATLPPRILSRVGNGGWKPHTAPADTACLVETAGEGWIAVGDAAASYDPLAAQGIMRALMSGLRAAEAIASAFAGSGQGLARYREMQSRAFAAYLVQRRYYYRAEKRWPRHSFWRSRYCEPVPLLEEH